MGLKGTSRRAARIRYEHRGLDFHEASLIQISPNRGDNLGALHEGLAHLRVHDEVNVALTVALVGVGETVELLRERLHALCEQGQLLRVNRNLTCLGLKDLAANADDVADIILLKLRIRLFADRIARHINLNVAAQISNRAEGRLAHDALTHHATCDRDFRVLKRLKLCLDFRGVVALLVGRNLKRVLARCL